ERSVLAALRGSKTDADFAAALHHIRDVDAWVAAKVKENGGPWLRWYFDYDPAATLAKVACPVLAINGALDRQDAARENVAVIRAEHLPVIAALVGRAEVTPEILRRNVVVAGINLLSLKDLRFAIGAAILIGTKPCAPCDKMELALGPGGFHALRGHGGICAR